MTRSVLAGLVAFLGLTLPLWCQSRQLSLLDALEQTLRLHPQLRISEELVQSSRAVREQALGAFDTVLQSNALQTRQHNPLVVGNANELQNRSADVSTIDASGTRLLRSGVSIETFVDVNRTAEYLLPLGLNTAQLAFQVRVPLLRGRGRKNVETQLTASGLEIDARLYELNQTISDLLAGTASSYWQYAAAMRTQEVLRESEDRGKVYIENVQALIEANRIPRNDLYQVRANLGSRSSSRTAADQNVTETRLQLAVAMGLGTADLESFGDPSDALPAGDLTPRPSVQKYVDQAIARRGDLRAAAKRQDSAQVVLEGRRNLTKPQVDLVLRTGYSGLREGSGPFDIVTSPFRGVQGLDAVTGVTFQFPHGNHEALGRVAEAQSNLKIAGQRKLDLERGIAASAMAALSAVETASIRLQALRRTVADFQLALAGERQKYQLGRSSIIDVLTLEDRLTSASISEVDAELGYALALVRLRQATATIVEPNRQTHTIDRNVFLKLPAEDQ